MTHHIALTHAARSWTEVAASFSFGLPSNWISNNQKPSASFLSGNSACSSGLILCKATERTSAQDVKSRMRVDGLPCEVSHVISKCFPWRVTVHDVHTGRFGDIKQTDRYNNVPERRAVGVLHAISWVELFLLALFNIINGSWDGSIGVARLMMFVRAVVGVQAVSSLLLEDLPLVNTERKFLIEWRIGETFLFLWWNACAVFMGVGRGGAVRRLEARLGAAESSIVS